MYVLLLGIGVLSNQAFANCRLIQPNNIPPGQSIPVQVGINYFSYDCNLTHAMVMHFPLDIIIHAEANSSTIGALESLHSARKAFLLPPGQYPLTLQIQAQRGRFVLPEVDSIAQFYAQDTLHTLTLSAFVGFCIALMIYVGMLGRSIQNQGFYAYSAYIAAAGLYFFLQEGIPNIIIPHIDLVNDIRIKILFAGLTVWTATRFIALLLDFPTLVAPFYYRALKHAANAVLIMAVAQAALSPHGQLVLTRLVASLTLVIISVIVLMTAYAVHKRVHPAKLVLIALLIMLFSMIFRLYLHAISPFLHRYGLIISVTIEALLLALAASEKVKRLEHDKSQAFRDATTDLLCQVLNRRGWETSAEHMLQRHAKEGGALALLFIDLNKFKAINDNYGHAIGDAVLARTAAVLREQCREQDLVGRLGGDEFVILSHCFSHNQAHRLQARITRHCQQLVVEARGHRVALSGSVGACIFDSPQQDIASLMHKADLKMYQVKQQTAV